MRLLLDTHIFIWSINDDRRLSKIVRSKILSASAVYISSASIWEAVIKIQIKKLEANVDQLIEAISGSGFTELPITALHAATLSSLHFPHRDPFDRILIAQAISEPLTLITADAHLRDYSELVEVIS